MPRQNRQRNRQREQDYQGDEESRFGGAMRDWRGDEQNERYRAMGQRNNPWGRRWDNEWQEDRGYGREWPEEEPYWGETYGNRYPRRYGEPEREFGARDGGYPQRWGQGYGLGYSERTGRTTYPRESFGGMRGGDWLRSREDFTGRGPRNYKRSDERILDEVNEQLTRHPMIDATDIDVTVKDGEVALKGTVDNRNVKRMAEDVTEDISGVKNVRNEIRVQTRREPSERAA